jgi:serine hydrolase
MEYQILIIPGWQSSNHIHWQTVWQNENPDYIRVEQKDWNHPDKEDWINCLQQYVSNSTWPVILVAHSLACCLVAHWSAVHNTDKVKAAFIIAPTDVDSPDHSPEELRSFSPTPTDPLPFESMVVASDNDHYVTIERAKYFAQCWGSEFVNIGTCGHINADSNLGSWEQGKNLFARLIKSAD